MVSTNQKTKSRLWILHLILPTLSQPHSLPILGAYEPSTESFLSLDMLSLQCSVRPTSHSNSTNNQRMSLFAILPLLFLNILIYFPTNGKADITSHFPNTVQFHPIPSYPITSHAIPYLNPFDLFPFPLLSLQQSHHLHTILVSIGGT